MYIHPLPMATGAILVEICALECYGTQNALAFMPSGLSILYAINPSCPCLNQYTTFSELNTANTHCKRYCIIHMHVGSVFHRASQSTPNSSTLPPTLSIPVSSPPFSPHLSQHCLAAPRRPVHEHSSWGVDADLSVEVKVCQRELHSLSHLLFLNVKTTY